MVISGETITPTTAPRPTGTLTLDPQTLPSSGGSITPVLYVARCLHLHAFVQSCPMGRGQSHIGELQRGLSGHRQATTTQQQWTFTFIATRSSGQTVSSSQTLVEAAPVDPAIQHVTTASWSGYAVNGGPFTSVSGTFTVPYIASDATCDDRVGEWVGIDGYGNESSLIQAGIDESDVDPVTGACDPRYRLLRMGLVGDCSDRIKPCLERACARRRFDHRHHLTGEHRALESRAYG